jgi:hypothetical protein
MQPPARDPGDFGIALRAKSTLFMPEIAKMWSLRSDCSARAARCEQMTGNSEVT